MAETVIDSNTGLMSNAFYLEVDGTPMTMLTGIQGLDVSVEATDMQQTTDKGKMVWTRTLGSRKNSGTLTLNRLAVDNATSDGIWQWFTKIKDKARSPTPARTVPSCSTPLTTPPSSGVSPSPTPGSRASPPTRSTSPAATR